MLLVERGLAVSRERARALILAGDVRVDGQPVTKAGTTVAPDAAVTVAVPDHPYVGRGGLKLAHAYAEFSHQRPQLLFRQRRLQVFDDTRRVAGFAQRGQHVARGAAGGVVVDRDRVHAASVSRHELQHPLGGNVFEAAEMPQRALALEAG